MSLSGHFGGVRLLLGHFEITSWHMTVTLVGTLGGHLGVILDLLWDTFSVTPAPLWRDFGFMLGSLWPYDGDLG